MRKKFLLIPTLLTIASTPLIGMVGCNKSTTATKQEMEDAISFKGIKYLQAHSHSKLTGISSYDLIEDTEFTPNIYHNIKTNPAPSSYYSEEYIVKKSDTECWSYTRHGETDPWKKEQISPEDIEELFWSIEDEGEWNLSTYTEFIDKGVEFLYDEKNKCYTANYVDPESQKTQSHSLFFENKKLTKQIQDENWTERGWECTSHYDYTYSYEEITPVPPEI